MDDERRLRWWVILAGLVLLLWGFSSRPAKAHVTLLSAEPEPGATLTTSPPEVRLTFDGEIVSTLSQIALFDEDFRPVTGIEVQPGPDDKHQVVAPLPPLTPGRYTVQWVVQAEDGHSLRGSFAFAITDQPAFGLWMILLPVASLLVLISLIILYLLRHKQGNP